LVTALKLVLGRVGVLRIRTPYGSVGNGEGGTAIQLVRIKTSIVMIRKKRFELREFPPNFIAVF